MDISSGLIGKRVENRVLGRGELYGVPRLCSRLVFRQGLRRLQELLQLLLLTSFTLENHECHLQVLRCSRPPFGSQFRLGPPKIFRGYRILRRGFLPMTETRLPFCSVEEAAEEIRQGRMIVLVDDEDRENEGDLTMAAEKITPEAINFMAKYGRGL